MMNQIHTETITSTATCEIHGKYETQIFMLGKKKITKPCPHCSKEKKKRHEDESREKDAERKADRIKALMSASNIPKRFASRTFENYRAETQEQQRALKIAKAYADRFEDRLANGGGLVFCGKPGTGKTHLATAVAKQVIKSSRSAVFTTAMQIIRRVKQTYSRDAQKSDIDVINEYKRPSLLIIDEVGVQFGSDAEKLILFEMLNGRYEEMLPTIVLSNLAESELGSYLGERVIDRLREGGGAVLAFTWDSYREHVHKDENLRCNPSTHTA